MGKVSDSTGVASKMTLSEAAKLPALARNGKQPHVGTLWRWAMSGVYGIKLQTTRVGGLICTTRRDVDGFLDAINNQKAAAHA